jgi:cell wall-associated NlpC family hydrolase
MPNVPVPGGPATVAASSVIASTFLRYKGVVPYKWAGHLPSTGWDCSGAVGYVLGHDLKLGLPAGMTWSAGSHGPVASQYKVWGGAKTVKSPLPGDLCCWLTHVGVYIGSGKMISALSPQYGTAITPVSFGPKGEPMSYRRVVGVPGGQAVFGGATAGAAGSPVGCVPGLIMMPGLLLVHLWRGRDHHGGAEIVGDDQDVILR